MIAVVKVVVIVNKDVNTLLNLTNFSPLYADDIQCQHRHYAIDFLIPFFMKIILIIYTTESTVRNIAMANTSFNFD